MNWTTPAEGRYLRAMVEVEGSAASTAAVAEHLGVPAGSLSPARQALIAKGIIYAEKRGYVSLTVPHTDRFILTQPDGD